jgi:paraquat-inducible protein B
MGKKVDKTLIGVFVTGAIALLVIAVVILGSGKFFRKTYKYVMFFQGSVKGLSVGAPVIFRGVRVGSVTDIDLVLDPKNNTLHIPVFIELEPERVKGALRFRRDPKAIQMAIERGLRAQLQMQSFVTGQLMISLDFFPDKPARYVGLIKGTQEIPTVETMMEELSKTLKELPLRDIVTKLDQALDGIQKIVNAPETKESIASLNATLKETRQLVEHIDKEIDPLAESLRETSGAARDALLQAKSTLSGIDANTKELVSEAEDTLHQAKSTLSGIDTNSREFISRTEDTLKTAERTLNEASKTLGTFSENSRLVYELNRTLRELSAASRSIKNLSEYLGQHPEALLKGKGSDKGE